MRLAIVRRYEAGSAQSSLEGLKKIALALHVSLDELVFDPSERGERGPQGERLTLLFEAVAGPPWTTSSSSTAPGNWPNCIPDGQRNIARP
jgi:transcriptional regulator with XRE-family HTH domain